MNKANNTLIKNQNVIKAEDFPLTISTNATLIDKPPVPAERPYLMSKLINNNTRERFIFKKNVHLSTHFY